MPDNVIISQTSRRAVQAMDDLQALHSSLMNSPRDRAATHDLMQDLRDAIETVQNILGRITDAAEGTVRSELAQEREAKSTAQEQRYASGPSCD